MGLIVGLELQLQENQEGGPFLVLGAIGFIVGRIIDTRRYRYLWFFPAILLLIGVLNLRATTSPEEKSAVRHFNQGVDALKIEDYDLAIICFSQVIKLNPSDSRAHLNRGGAHIRKSEFDEAVTDFTRAIKVDPKYVEAYVNRSLAYTRTGHYELAIADANMALSLNTNCAAAYYSRGLSFRETGQLDKADADIEKAFQINPDLGKK